MPRFLMTGLWTVDIRKIHYDKFSATQLALTVNSASKSTKEITHVTTNMGSSIGIGVELHSSYLSLHLLL